MRRRTLSSKKEILEGRIIWAEMTLIFELKSKIEFNNGILILLFWENKFNLSKVRG
jgi:hypothetical protein